MGLFSAISDFFNIPAGDLDAPQIILPATDDQVPDAGYCTASGSEPTWHNGFGTEADFSTANDPFGSNAGGFDHGDSFGGGFGGNFGE